MRTNRILYTVGKNCFSYSRLNAFINFLATNRVFLSYQYQRSALVQDVTLDQYSQLTEYVIGQKQNPMGCRWTEPYGCKTTYVLEQIVSVLLLVCTEIDGLCVIFYPTIQYSLLFRQLDIVAR